jgi:uncharacterized protein
MPTEVSLALCLVLVIEGMMLAAFPGFWKQAVLELSALPPERLRRGGVVVMLIGLALFFWVRGS